VIEDAPAGIQSARTGGMQVIGLASTYGAGKLSEADAVVRAFSGIQVSANGAGKLAVTVR